MTITYEERQIYEKVTTEYLIQDIKWFLEFYDEEGEEEELEEDPKIIKWCENNRETLYIYYTQVYENDLSHNQVISNLISYIEYAEF